MSMGRDDLKRGFLDDMDELVTWKDSYHESDSLAFAGPSKRMYCDDCDLLITPGSCYSIGNRQVQPDAPIYGTWIDKIHINCQANLNETEIFKDQPPNKIPGWAFVPEEEKSRYLSLAGMEDNAENRKAISVLGGMSCVIVGDFPQSKEKIISDIESNGGKVLAAVTKTSKVSHIVLGTDGVTKYGQSTGKGSQKYKDAMKKKPTPIIVDYAFIEQSIGKGVSIFPEEVEKKGQKRKIDDVEGEKQDGDETKKMKVEESLFEEEKLKKMKRKQLQSLCKKHSILANASSELLIGELLKIKKGTKTEEI